MLRVSIVFSLIATYLLSTSAHASCESALVISTYNSQSDIRSDWRLADLVDQSSYEKIKHDAGAHAVIYGVPVGANYSDYKDAASKLRHDHNESLSRSELVNIAWTGLDPQAPSVYRDCLNTSVFLENGLHAAIVAATETDISVLVKWFVPGQPGSATVIWNPSAVGDEQIRKEFPQGLTPVRLPRPVKQLSLSGGFNGFATEVMVLEPLPEKVKETPILGPKIVERINGGAIFTLTTVSILPGGHIGTIYPLRALTGTFTSGTKAWRVTGPNGSDGHLVTAEYCSTCSGRTASDITPDEHKLDIWGAVFSFDDLGNVFLGSDKVGVLTVQ
jgi:hypothetical protein